MKSKVDLLFNQATQYQLDKATLNKSGRFTMAQGKVRQIDFESGSIIVQSYSNYLVFVELYELEVTQTTIIDFKIKDSGLFLFLMLAGSSIFEDHKGRRISESDGNSCAFAYLGAGLYRRLFLPGIH